MPIVHYIDENGQSHMAKVKTGTTLMRGAIVNGIAGIEARCGGVMSCGTCRVALDDKWLKMLPPATEAELCILELHDDTRECHRLSCQIKMRDDLDGIVVTVAS